MGTVEDSPPASAPLLLLLPLALFLVLAPLPVRAMAAEDVDDEEGPPREYSASDIMRDEEAGEWAVPLFSSDAVYAPLAEWMSQK